MCAVFQGPAGRVREFERIAVEEGYLLWKLCVIPLATEARGFIPTPSRLISQDLARFRRGC